MRILHVLENDTGKDNEEERLRGTTGTSADEGSKDFRQHAAP
jgi:hypothetical protein